MPAPFTITLPAPPPALGIEPFWSAMTPEMVVMRPADGAKVIDCAIAADLRVQGLSLSDPAGVDALIRDVLLAHGSAFPDQMAAATQVQLAAALDRSYLLAATSA